MLDARDALHAMGRAAGALFYSLELWSTLVLVTCCEMNAML
jgi:hypothetical protein